MLETPIISYDDCPQTSARVNAEGGDECKELDFSRAVQVGDASGRS